MELLESDDLKSHLMRKASRHKEDLENEARFISEKTQGILMNALVIGGSLALAYLLVRRVTSSDSSNRKTKIIAKPSSAALETENYIVQSVETEGTGTESFLEKLGTRFVNQASEMLLTIAREKLVELLDSVTPTATVKPDEDGNTRVTK